MLDEPLNVLRLQRVEHVPEVLTLWQPSVESWIRHVKHEDCILLHEQPELLHGEFVIPRDAAVNDLAELEQLLILDKKLFHKVSVKHLFRRHVELQLIRHV